MSRIPTGRGPQEVATSDDGAFAFLTNYRTSNPGRTIPVLDLAGRKELRRVEVGPLRRPHGIVFGNRH